MQNGHNSDEYSECLLFSEMVSTQTLLGNITKLFPHRSCEPTLCGCKTCILCLILFILAKMKEIIHMLQWLSLAYRQPVATLYILTNNLWLSLTYWQPAAATEILTPCGYQHTNNLWLPLTYWQPVATPDIKPVATPDIQTTCGHHQHTDNLWPPSTYRQPVATTNIQTTCGHPWHADNLWPPPAYRQPVAIPDIDNLWQPPTYRQPVATPDRQTTSGHPWWHRQLLAASDNGIQTTSSYPWHTPQSCPQHTDNLTYREPAPEAVAPPDIHW